MPESQRSLLKQAEAIEAQDFDHAGSLKAEIEQYGPCTCITSACATQSKKPTTRGRPLVTPNSRCDGCMHDAHAIATPRSKVPA